MTDRNDTDPGRALDSGVHLRSAPVRPVRSAWAGFGVVVAGICARAVVAVVVEVVE
jgi:hypothetical protein